MTVLSEGVFLISSYVMDFIVLATGISSYPCANLPSSNHIAFFRLSFKIGPSIRVLYFVIVSLVTRWTTPLAYSSISICEDVGSSSLANLCGIDHCGVSNIALPKYAHSTCGDIMLTGDFVESLIAILCNLRSRSCITLIGSWSSSWVIVEMFWRKLGDDFFSVKSE